jgi:nitrite reductase/ring-hydroxylating ferredoxin subunit
MSESSKFDEALEQILADHSPREQLHELSPEESDMVRMAQLLRGTVGGAPSPVFRAELANRLAREPRKISRRSAFFTSAAALAAGVLAGFGLDRVFRGGHGNSGWVEVAQADTLHDGAVKPFVAGGKQGFVIRQSGQVRALSRLCTDIGCPLNFSDSTHMLVCPCHGAEFDLTGRNVEGAGDVYKVPLPALHHFKTQVQGNSVQVWVG